MTPSSQTSLLFQRYLEGTATVEEKAEFVEILRQAQEQGTLDALLMSLWEGATVSEPVFTRREENEMLKTILKTEKAVVRPMVWRSGAVAACLILLLGLGAYFIFAPKRDQPQKATAKTTLPKDIEAPATIRAMITLADGNKVYLDSVGKGTIATQSNITVEKAADGKIVYQPTNGVATEMVYNTLTNPRGSKVIDMQLSDGSHVWLNAGSSITYPVAFLTHERKVEITGEAYFEVVHDATKPFHVQKGETEVTVLGTHFNVNAYEDEDALKVTLLEGSVKVSSGNHSSIIKPKEQAIIYQANPLSTPIQVQKDVDVDAVMAWKNGTFEFGGQNIEAVMRQISRWYDVEVVYEGEIPVVNFRGAVSRQESISEVVKMLELTKAVKFRIEGKKIIVTK